MEQKELEEKIIELKSQRADFFKKKKKERDSESIKKIKEDLVYYKKLARQKIRGIEIEEVAK